MSRHRVSAGAGKCRRLPARRCGSMAIWRIAIDEMSAASYVHQRLG